MSMAHRILTVVVLLLHLQRGLPAKQVAKQLAEPPLFKARDHIPQIVKVVNGFTSKRGLEVMELFGGCGAVCREAKRQGLKTFSYDIVAGGPKHNIVSKHGFWLALHSILSLGVGGLVMAGPPCAWWIWLSKSVHQRTKSRPSGKLSHPKVRLNNIIVDNTVVLLAVALCRQVFVVIEQPETSLMRCFRSMKRLIHASLTEVLTWMGCFAHALPKPSRIWSSLPSIESLRRKWDKANKLAHELKHPVAQRKAYKYAPSGVAGAREELTATAAYTVQFAKAVLSAWSKDRSNPTAKKVVRTFLPTLI